MNNEKKENYSQDGEYFQDVMLIGEEKFDSTAWDNSSIIEEEEDINQNFNYQDNVDSEYDLYENNLEISDSENDEDDLEEDDLDEDEDLEDENEDDAEEERFNDDDLDNIHSLNPNYFDY